MARDGRRSEQLRPTKVFAEDSVVVGKRKPHEGGGERKKGETKVRRRLEGKKREGDGMGCGSKQE